MAITFDPVSRRIVLDTASVTAEEIFSRWEDWVVLADNSKYLPAFRHAGGDDLGSGLFIPNYMFLLNNWRVRPMESSHNLTITGNLFVDGGGVPVVPTLGTFQVNVNYTVPVLAQGISTSGSSGPTTSEIADAVWAKQLSSIETGVILQGIKAGVDAMPASIRTELSVELAKIMTLENNPGLTVGQATMLLEMYDLLGLDPTKPLVVTTTARTAGTISQTIDSNPSSTIVTRI